MYPDSRRKWQSKGKGKKEGKEARERSKGERVACW
jgi:hypothetical protein